MEAPILYHRIKEQYRRLLTKDVLAEGDDQICRLLLALLSIIQGSSSWQVVYIASPYSNGDKEANVRRQIDVANELLDRGYIPIVPLLSHYWHMQTQQHYLVWMLIDLVLIVKAADYVLRLDGESDGADLEVFVASMRGIPIVHSLEELEGQRGR